MRMGTRLGAAATMATAALLTASTTAQATVYPGPAGPRVVHGAIEQEWLAIGGARSVVGSPVTDELPTPRRSGAFNHFERGSVYWSPASGAHQIGGAIRDRWASLGWENGVLGFPVTDESGTPDGVGRANHFQNGSVYWTPRTGAHQIGGAIRDRWAALGWEGSVLGYPITDELPTPDGVGRFNHFQNGSVYWTPRTGAQQVAGAVRDKWASLGWERSTLGYPTRGEYGWSGRRRTDFQGGYITWTPSEGAVVTEVTYPYGSRVQFRSTGPQSVDLDFPTQPQIAEVTTEASTGLFRLYQVSTDGYAQGTVAGASGAYNQVVPVNWRTLGSIPYRPGFYVDADGPWTVRLSPLSAVGTFGNGQTVSEARSTIWHYTGPGGVAHLRHDSPGFFIATYYDRYTSYAGEQVRTSGAYDGTIPIRPDTYLVVESGGPWSIRVD
jgi:uncharacterized protein with LGFP repeats